jgi:MshEN domain
MGDPLQNGDVIHRLEAAIDRWSAELAEAQTGLDRGFTKVRDHMGTLPPGERSPATEALQAVAEALTGARAVIVVLVERVSALEQALIQAARDDAEKADAHWNDLLGRIDRLAGDVAELKASQDRTGGAEDQADQTTASGVAEQLSHALRDREEAHQEIVKLRQTLEAARAAAGQAAGEPGRPMTDRPEHGGEGALAWSTGEELAVGPLEAFDADGQRRRMAEILVRAGVLTMEQVRESLATQEREPQKRLGSILVEQGMVSEAIVGRVLASQLRLPFVVLGQESLDAAAVDLVGRKLAAHHRCFPVRIDGGRLVLAMANPLDLIAIEDVELATGQRVDPVVAAGEDIGAAIERAYGPAVSA